MSSDACATCAQIYATPSEKPLFPGRTLPCCSRTICARCLNQNKRYETYCPYCQFSTAPSSLPQGLRDPPAYSSLDGSSTPTSKETSGDEALPPYEARGYTGSKADDKGASAPAEDVLHFIAPGDSMRSLALAYDVPIEALRKTNNVYSDHLVQARKTLLIPGEHYKGGVSLSPQPLESEEEEIKKNKLRRWMMACKVAEYDVATLYMQQAEWDLDAAVEAYKEDERWEKEHPMQAREKGKRAKSVGMRRFVGSSSAAGQS